MKKVEVAI